MQLLKSLGTGFNVAVAATVFSSAVYTTALAADYPDKVVQAIVPFGAGGGTDRWARVMSSVGFDVFESGMRVQNRGGAAGTVGWKHLLDKGADGHSLLLASPTPVLAALAEKDPPFDPAAVKIVAYYSVMKPTLMAPKNKPYSTWEGLVNHLKTADKKLTLGATMTQALGPASLLNQLGLADRVILVTYSGTGKAVNDFLGGHVDLVAVTTSTATTLAGRATAVVNASDLDYPEKIAKELGNVPNAKSLGLKPFNPPRFVAMHPGMHPDTSDEQVKIMSEKMGELLGTKSVKKLIGKLGEEITFVPTDKATVAYQSVLNEAKKNLPLFQ